MLPDAEDVEKMPMITDQTTQAVDDAAAQVRRLRNEMETVMRDTVAPALAGAFERAATATQYTTGRVRRHSETVIDGVRVRPLTSIVVAWAVGFLFGRVTR